MFIIYYIGLFTGDNDTVGRSHILVITLFLGVMFSMFIPLSIETICIYSDITKQKKWPIQLCLFIIPGLTTLRLPIEATRVTKDNHKRHTREFNMWQIH
jgi:hypothetical protein